MLVILDHFVYGDRFVRKKRLNHFVKKYQNLHEKVHWLLNYSIRYMPDVGSKLRYEIKVACLMGANNWRIN